MTVTNCATAYVIIDNRWSTKLDLQSLLGSMCTMHSYIHWLTPNHRPPPKHPHLGSYTRALFVSQDRRHLFVTRCHRPMNISNGWTLPLLFPEQMLPPPPCQYPALICKETGWHEHVPKMHKNKDCWTDTSFRGKDIVAQTPGVVLQWAN
jgi:hypothetical protein